MDSNVLAILENLHDGRHLKDLYVLGFSGKNKRKLLLRFLNEEPIEHLCKYVERFLKSTSHIPVTSIWRKNLKMKSFVASCHMFIGIVYIFNGKVDDVFGGICKSINDMVKQKKQLVSPRHSSSNKRSIIRPAQNITLSEESLMEIELDLGESLTHTSILSKVQRSGIHADSETNVTINEDDVLRAVTHTSSELNTEFLKEFCGGDANSMERLQNSWSSSGPSMFLPEENTLSVPDSFEHQDKICLSSTLPSISAGVMSGSFEQECSNPLNSSIETNSEECSSGSSMSHKRRNSFLISANAIQNRMKNWRWKANMLLANLSIDDDPEVSRLEDEEKQGDISLEATMIDDETCDFEFEINFIPKNTATSNGSLASFTLPERDTSEPQSLTAAVFCHHKEIEDSQVTSPEHFQEISDRHDDNDEDDGSCRHPDIMSSQSIHPHSIPTHQTVTESGISISLADDTSKGDDLESTENDSLLPNIEFFSESLSSLEELFANDSSGFYTYNTPESYEDISTYISTYLDIFIDDVPEMEVHTTKNETGCLELNQRKRYIKTYKGLQGTERRRRQIKKQNITEHMARIPVAETNTSERYVEVLDEPMATDHIDDILTIIESEHNILPVKETSGVKYCPPSSGYVKKRDNTLNHVSDNKKKWTETTFLYYLKLISTEKNNSVTFSQLCDQNSSRMEVAHTFSLLLSLAAKQIIQMKQTRPFDPDSIFIHIPPDRNGFSAN